MSKPAVFGIVETETQARGAVGALEKSGFLAADISVLSRNHEQVNDLDYGPLELETGEKITGRTRNVGHRNATKAPEGISAGVATGGAVGALAGWLIGIGAVAVPGLGAFVVAGPVFAALGAAVGAAAGGIVGGLVGLGIPEYEAKIYAGKLELGHILIGVHAVNEEEANAAFLALKQNGAHDIKVTTEVCLKTGNC